MGVYIKGFPFPNNCGACPLRLAWCRERIYMVARPERCPLVPVPPHGRLIDADKPTVLTDTNGRAIKVTVAHIIENNGGAVDAVIPAEE